MNIELTLDDFQGYHQEFQSRTRSVIQDIGNRLANLKEQKDRDPNFDNVEYLFVLSSIIIFCKLEGAI